MSTGVLRVLGSTVLLVLFDHSEGRQYLLPRSDVLAKTTSYHPVDQWSISNLALNTACLDHAFLIPRFYLPDSVSGLPGQTSFLIRDPQMKRDPERRVFLMAWYRSSSVASGNLRSAWWCVGENLYDPWFEIFCTIASCSELLLATRVLQNACHGFPSMSHIRPPDCWTMYAPAARSQGKPSSRNTTLSKYPSATDVSL